MTLALTTPLAARDLARPDSYADTLSLMQEALAANPVVSDLTIDSAEDSVRLTINGQDLTLYPDNLHNALRNAESAAERGAVLDDFVTAILESGDRKDSGLSPDTLANLRPVLRNTGLGAGLEIDDPVIRQSFAGDLAMFWVIDTPRDMSYVSASMLTDAGIGQDEVAKRALENLATFAPQAKWTDLTPKAAYIEFDGAYESSFALLPDLWRGFRGWQPLIMAVPARDVFILADGSDAETVEMLRGLAHDIAEKDGTRLSAGIYRFDGSGWASY